MDAEVTPKNFTLYLACNLQSETRNDFFRRGSNLARPKIKYGEVKTTGGCALVVVASCGLHKVSLIDHAHDKRILDDLSRVSTRH